MALISFMCLSLSVSYSYVLRSRVSGNALVITTGNLTSTVTYTSKDLFLISQSDDDGLAQDEYGIINIAKNNVYSVFYTMNIGYAVDELPSDKTAADLLPMEYIRVALYEISGGSLSENPIVGPIKLTDLTVSSVNADSVYRDTFLLNYGTFNSGNQTKTFGLKVWLDENTPISYDEYLIYLGISVNQETLVSKSIYNLSGKVLNSSGSAISGATVKFHNGKVTSTTAADGTYSLNNVPTGTYNISVLYNGVEYKTTMHVKYGQSVALQSTGGATGAASTYLQSSAYTYYTSPGLIMSANNLSTTSNQLTTSTYTIPNAYVLTGLESLSILSINNLNLTLNNDNTLSIALAS